MGYWLGQEKRAYREMNAAAYAVIEKTGEVQTFILDMGRLGYDRHEAIRVAKTAGQLGLTVEQLEQFVMQERSAWREATL
jgi:hypothetical protein